LLTTHVLLSALPVAVTNAGTSITIDLMGWMRSVHVHHDAN